MMRQFSEEGRRALGEIAARYAVGFEAVEHLLMAVIAGHTTQAQFNHPELGGMGQWSQGGMTMVGDMFNNGLKAKVDGLCNELANLARGADMLWQPAPMQSQSQSQGGSGASLFVPGAFSSANWWPDELGFAGSTGSQNDLRYAFFPATHRLAINAGGRITVYDTRDHQIGGFSQQQSGDQSVSFTSQYGLVNLSSLDVVPFSDGEIEQVSPPEERLPQSITPIEAVKFEPPLPVQTTPSVKSDDDIFAKIERLATLYEKGILTDEEYKSKKTELLSRL
ncbi:MAG: hypothetical protein JWM58_3935 [Rhizobium sp.]|nr:hypothetical protein [Rhizobium sp.]